MTQNISTTPSMPRRHALAWLLAGLTPAVLAQTELTDLARIRASGVLKVAVYKDYAPLSFGPANNMQGLDVALAQALARQLNLTLSLLPFDAGENMNDDLRNMVWRGHYLGYGPADVMLQVPVDRYLIQKNPQALIFAPYMRQTYLLLHDLDRLPQVQNPEDLQGAALAVERGTGGASALMGHGGGLLRAQVSIYNDGMDAVQAVVDGKVAAAYVTRAQAEAVLLRHDARRAQFRLTSLMLRGVPENGWPVGMAIKAEHKDLGQALEKALQALRDSGELLAIFKQQGMTLTAP